MSYLWAFNDEASGKIALGPLNFMLVGADRILDPQPTDDQIARFKIDGYLKKVKVEEAVPAAPLSETFEVSVDAQTSDQLPPPVEEEDELFEPAEAPVDYEKLSLAELRELAQGRGFMNYQTAQRATLLRQLKG